MQKKIALASLIFVFTFLLPVPASAHHQARVLGASTSSSELSIPPTVEGPGLILPDSPLFFLDQIKQSTRILFAFTPEAKASIHKQIAGERMAELRLMLAKNHNEGIQMDLQGISDNLTKAAESVRDASLTGRDVSALAKTINDDIKVKIKILDLLESKAGGEIEARTKAASISLLIAKVKVEDSLPEDKLQSEIEDDLSLMVQKNIRDASESAEEMKEELNELQNQVNYSSANALKKREEALKKAIEEKNESLKKQAEKDLNDEKRKQDQLLKVHQSAVDQAREAVTKAQDAARKFNEVQQKVTDLKNSDTQIASSKGQDIKGEE